MYPNNVVPILISVPSKQQVKVGLLPAVNLMHDFKHRIKRDAAQFSTLKNDAAWDNWNCGTIAQTRAQDIAGILDPTYIPATTDDADLFLEKQKFMYTVFEKTLQTDKGKALVCQHQHSFDAQRIYKELSEYHKYFTKASMNAFTLLSYITTSNLYDGM